MDIGMFNSLYFPVTGHMFGDYGGSRLTPTLATPWANTSLLHAQVVWIVLIFYSYTYIFPLLHMVNTFLCHLFCFV